MQVLFWGMLYVKGDKHQFVTIGRYVIIGIVLHKGMIASSCEH